MDVRIIPGSGEQSFIGTDNTKITKFLADANGVVTVKRHLTTTALDFFKIAGFSSNILTITDTSGSELSLTGSGTISGNLTVMGDLFINGEVNQMNVTELNIDDKIIRLNNGGTSAAASGGGITLVGDSAAILASLTYTSSRWLSNLAIETSVTTGTAPFVVASTTLVSNLNSDLLDGMHAVSTNTVSSVVSRDASGNFSAAAVTVNSLTAIGTTTASAILGGIQASWAGSVNYPTLYSSNVTRYIMLINPHISYVQSGTYGYTGTMNGASIRFAAQPAATNYWDLGVGTNAVGNDVFSIGRSAVNFLTVNNVGLLSPTSVSLINDATDTFKHRVMVYGGNEHQYGMMLWNTSTTVGEWATMIVSPGGANRRISFGKVNTGAGITPSLHAHITEIAHFHSSDNSLNLTGQLKSTVAGGTAPLVVASTTLVTNFNSDLWDGYQFADYLNQGVRTTDSPTFTNLVLSASDTANTIYSGANIKLINSETAAFGRRVNLLFGIGVDANNQIGAAISAVYDNWNVTNKVGHRLEFFTKDAAVDADPVLQWTIDKSGTLSSNGAKTITTSTGNLTLSTSAGNGHIVLNPNGAGFVGIGTDATIPTALLHVSRNGTTGQFIRITNSGTGTASYSGVQVGEDGTSKLVSLYYLNSSFTTSGSNFSNSGVLVAQSSATGGLTLRTDANAPITFVTSGIANIRWQILGDGIFQSTGAQTIRTTTGNLTLATGAANGNIELLPNGSGALNISSGSYTGIALKRLAQNGGMTFTAEGWDTSNVLRASSRIVFAQSAGSGFVDGSIFFSTYTSGVETSRWAITNAGILESTGAQTIRTTTGALTLATAAGDGNIVLTPHGTGIVTTAADLAVNGGDITTSATTATLFNATATTLSIGGAATTLTLGGTTASSTLNLGTGATIASSTKTINIGTGGAASSTTNVNIGSAVAGTTTLSSPAISVLGVLTATGRLVTTSGGTATYNITQADADTSAIFGTVTTKRAYLKLWGITAAAYGVIQMTTENLHIDASTVNSGKIYLNHYNSAGNVIVGPAGTTSYKLNVNGTLYSSGAVTLASNITVAGTYIANGTSTRDKIRVWDSSLYTIGMQSGFTFGSLNSDYAMTFQMNNDNDRGWWWGDDQHTVAQGAMALSTTGLLTVAGKIRVGYGESDTTIPTTYGLDLSGDIGLNAQKAVISQQELINQSVINTYTAAQISSTLFKAAYFDYVLYSGTNQRAGTIIASWNGTALEWTEYTTLTQGTISDTEVLLAADENSGNIRLRMQVLSGTWSIKVFARGV